MFVINMFQDRGYSSNALRGGNKKCFFRKFSIKTVLKLTIGLGVDSSVPHFLDSIEERGEDSGEGEEISLQLGTLTEELLKHWQAGLSDGFRILSELCLLYLALRHNFDKNIRAALSLPKFHLGKLDSVSNNYQL